MRKFVESFMALAVVMGLSIVPVEAASLSPNASPAYRDTVRKLDGYGDPKAGSLDGIHQNIIDSLAYLMGPPDSIILCGENAENGTTYFGPATGPFGGNGADISIGSTGCDALDNVTEATADAPIFTDIPFKVLGFWCRTDGTLGAGETITFTARTAAASTSPALTCTISEAEVECRAIASAPANIAAGAAIAMRVVQVSNNSDDNAWCRVALALR